MKIYAISGLGADHRVFQQLKLGYELVPVVWLKPKVKETITAYAIRLAQKINTNDKFAIIGVSFGGLIAIEISKILNPVLTILISSAETKSELRTIYSIIGKSKLLQLIPNMFFNPPRIIANWLFGTKEKKLLNAILNDTDLSFAKWAIIELLNWQNDEKLCKPILKIAGTNDKLIPPKTYNNTKLIKNGEHFMIVDCAAEISGIINEALNKI